MDEYLKKTSTTSAGPAPDNEKLVYQYQVEALKDDIVELEESYILLQKDHKEKSRVSLLNVWLSVRVFYLPSIVI